MIKCESKISITVFAFLLFFLQDEQTKLCCMQEGRCRGKVCCLSLRTHPLSFYVEAGAPTHLILCGGQWKLTFYLGDTSRLSITQY